MAALSHDLKTPLTRVRMQLESLSDRPEALRSIEDVREMNTLIDRTLELFRDAQATEALQDTDVHALAAALVDDLAERGEAVQLHGSRAIARAQPVALRRVLGNLIGNAIRYASAAEVTVAQDQLTVTVRVEDRGPGIAPEHLERVFEPFFRVESSRSRASGGTGLGLYIARDLTLRQGGTLTLANRAGGGLCATVTLARSEVTRLH
jgi:signal transduction histidine kinase